MGVKRINVSVIMKRTRKQNIVFDSKGLRGSYSTYNVGLLRDSTSIDRHQALLTKSKKYHSVPFLHCHIFINSCIISSPYVIFFCY